jgi:2-polyprenyl-6-methoxyphenol hydroxylase-like FAD-dependent oxidoreductase
VTDRPEIRVHGNATAEELAALLAALADHHPSTVDSPYERWRRGRIAAAQRAEDGPTGTR